MFRKRERQKEGPTAKPKTFLERVMERNSVEAREKRIGRPANVDEVPPCDMNHGCPGAGESESISWLRAACEQVLGLTHGVQFVCICLI